MRQDRTGFSLLEVMVAIGILTLVLVGALTGLVAASQNVSTGQMEQYETALVEARVQNLLLADKTQLTSGSTMANEIFGTVGTYPGKPLSQVAIGTSPWQIDPNPPNPSTPTFPYPLNNGALFNVDPTGKVVQLTTGSAASCADSTNIPVGTLCREVAYLQTMPNGTAPITGNAYTLCTRVSRMGDSHPSSNPSLNTVVDCEVILQ
jgi:prepilin-type N-terminal cleavage/methylation domain-containing protein